jgi:hypothetical protein
MKIIGLYHKNCTDGTTAAAVILRKFPDATVIPIEHNFKDEDFEQILGQIDEDTIVYIVDFALKPEYLNKVLVKAKKVINLDHHISMKNILEEIKTQNLNLYLIMTNQEHL